MKSKIIFVFLLFLMIFWVPTASTVFATENDEEKQEDIQKELEDATFEQLNSVDFSKLQDILNDLDENSKKAFGSNSFLDKTQKILNGDFQNDYQSFFGALFSTFFSDILKFLPLLITIVIITVLCNIIGSFKSSVSQNGVSQIINFVCFGVASLIIISVVVSLFGTVKSSLKTMQTEMNIIFPILLTCLASVGGSVSVGIFQPVVAILANIVVNVFVFVVMPIFVFMFVLNIINNFSDSIKLNKLISFLSSALKWICGISFSVFLGAISLQGIVAGSFDSVSIKATKFALKSYVPILGGYLSDGFNIAMAGSVLIKNAVGVSGILLICSSVIIPIISIICFMLLLKLTAGILEPIGDSTIPNFLYQVSKTLSLLIMIVLGVLFMFVITVGLILCMANIV
ncbi:MAG: hypothetical protein IJ837_03300 [Clostridia bacterium]|nr:hypothetical protein [Clostridia bacterium]